MAGPFVLIIIGFVFLLSTMHVLSVGRLAHLFANYWPVLLILWGVAAQLSREVRAVGQQLANHDVNDLGELPAARVPADCTTSRR